MPPPLLFSYNILNLPCGVTAAAGAGGGTPGSLTYTYLSDGTKVSAIKSDGSGKRYVGSMVYSVPASGNGSLDLGKVDFGARMHDPFSARWTTHDPMAFVSPEASPYSYCLGDPIGCYDPLGLTNYSVNGEMRTIDDGYDDTIEVSERQFRRVNRIWNQGLGEKYDAVRSSIMDSNGYVDGFGNPVLAASSVSAQFYYSPFLAATTAVFAADLSAPEPTDLYPAKWAAYAGVYAVASISELVAKRDREIERLKRRSDGPYGIVYSLRTTHDGLYPDVRKGLVYMEKGEVWKYGETIQQPPEARYRGKANLERQGLVMIRESSGSQKQIKIEEKYYLYYYYFQNGHLPPGNSIFR